MSYFPVSDLSDDYHMAMIGNGRTCVLVDAEASFVFACMPDFDSGTVFASLLDEEKGGRFGIEMVGGHVADQRYFKDTNILQTRFEGEDGIFEVIDFMPRYTWDGRAGSRDDVSADIVRIIRLKSGKPRLKVNFDPQLEYALGETKIDLRKTGLKATATAMFTNQFTLKPRSHPRA